MAKRTKSSKTTGRKRAGAKKPKRAAGKKKVSSSRGAKRPLKKSAGKKKNAPRKMARAGAKSRKTTDFGIPAGQARKPVKAGGRDKGPDQGTGMERSGSQGTRETAVGWQVGTPGSGSGGDVDTDVIGIGADRGVAASPAEETGPTISSEPDNSEEDDFDDVESRHEEQR